MSLSEKIEALLLREHFWEILSLVSPAFQFQYLIWSKPCGNKLELPGLLICIMTSPNPGAKFAGGVATALALLRDSVLVSLAFSFNICFGGSLVGKNWKVTRSTH